MRSLPALPGLVLLALPLLIASVSATACSGKQGIEADDADAGDNNPVVTPATTDVAPAPSPVMGPAGTGLATGLPCDVQGVIENRCLACHGSPPANGAPVSLLTYDDLAAKSTMDPTKSRAELALQLMQAKQMPPAPAVPPDDDEIAAFAAWVQAGAPKNNAACTDPPPSAVDGGVPDAGTADAGSTCLSGTFWKNGNDGSQLMHPGGACNTCHQLNDGPNLRVGGTVFKGPHEPDDCNGAAPPPALTVIITDSRNQKFRLPVNTAGNFLTTQKVRPPLRAQVTDGKNTRQMNGSVTSGDCNSCHTVAGANGAPGRILAP